MGKNNWHKILLSSNYEIVIHEAGEFEHSSELKDKIVIRVINKENGLNGFVWLIPISPAEAKRIGMILSSVGNLHDDRPK